MHYYILSVYQADRNPLHVPHLLVFFTLQHYSVFKYKLVAISFLKIVYLLIMANTNFLNCHHNKLRAIYYPWLFGRLTGLFNFHMRSLSSRTVYLHLTTN